MNTTNQNVTAESKPGFGYVKHINKWHHDCNFGTKRSSGTLGKKSGESVARSSVKSERFSRETGGQPDWQQAARAKISLRNDQLSRGAEVVESPPCQKPLPVPYAYNDYRV